MTPHLSSTMARVARAEERILRELRGTAGVTCLRLRNKIRDVPAGTYKRALHNLKTRGQIEVEGAALGAVYRLPARRAGGG